MMNEPYDALRADDPLLALLDADGAAGIDIEERVLAAVADEEHAALRREVSDLRAEIAALRADLSALKRAWPSPRIAQPAPPEPAYRNDSRGMPLLPYAHREPTPSIFES
jgi:hypothetical protein